MSRSSLAGLLIMIVSEAATLAGLEPFRTWNTPICWTGFIVCADGVVFRARGRSWLRSTPRDFLVLALLSIPLWLVFEFYNLSIRNWYYVGLPENRALRLFGYAWSFATIWPALFEAAALVAVSRGRLHPARETFADPPAPAASRPLAAASIVAGAAMLVWPLAWPSPYLAAPVWLGFVFLLDPVNAWLGAPSLGADLRAGRFGRTIDLMIGGLLCGFLWEFWNFWGGAKWHYTVPILQHVKIFEMPLPGYLGFPAFALESFTMYVFVRSSAGRTRCNFPLGEI
jgi:hypothetical protein